MVVTKSGKGGFTLVELLIVVMIIGILAGMMLLSAGSATDSAETAKIINDLRSLKGAALLYYVDYRKWPTDAQKASLDIYTDRQVISLVMAGDPNRRYDAISIGANYTDSLTGAEKANIGVTLMPTGNGTEGVRKKLENRALQSGLLRSATSGSDVYTASGMEVWVNMK
jgi:general secretion pathway protein G